MNISANHQAELKADPDFIRQAVNQANVGVLRIALYHQTKDPELLAMQPQEWAIRGGALTVHSVAKEHHQTIRDKAFEFLTSDAQPAANPNKQEVAELIKMYTGKAPEPLALDYGYEELAYEAFPRDVQWCKPPSAEVLENFKVTIIGTGFSGIAAAIYMQRLGIPFQIIERHSDLGGTWLINDYPEARVDVSTFLYQYKFEKDFKWQHYYAPRDELKKYTDYIVNKHGLRDKISFSTELKSAVWDEDRNEWCLTLKDGQDNTTETRSNAVISASGLFNTPKRPDIPGLDEFQGEIFHTTEWNHDFDYSGKRVAQIGTGSTGIQLARGVAMDAGHLTIFQRTASWVTPVAGYHAELSEHKQWMLENMPGYRNWFVFLNYFAELQMQKFQELDPEWIKEGGRVNEANAGFREDLIAYVKTKLAGRPDLVEKCIPDVVPMARRLVIDNQWYETIMRDNVSLNTDGIERIDATGIIDGNGKHHPVDLIVLSSGFDTSQYVLPTQYRGLDGVKLEEIWQRDGARAFKGMTVPGFPNFFMMYGPNGQARIGSFHSWAENFSRYISGLLVSTLEQGHRCVAVKQSAFDDYNSSMDEAMKNLLWETETGDSYYVNQHGRSGVNMPWDVHQFYGMIQSPDVENYDIW